LLADDSFFDPAFLAGLNWGDVADPGGLLVSLTTAGVVLVTLGSIVDVAWKTWGRGLRARRP
jgi:hypothetical protein